MNITEHYKEKRRKYDTVKKSCINQMAEQKPSREAQRAFRRKPYQFNSVVQAPDGRMTADEYIADKYHIGGDKDE